MNAVIGMTGLLLDTELAGEQREFVETVRASGDALLVIINDILDFSKIESGQLDLEQVSFELRECVEGSLDLVAAAAALKGLELVSEVDEGCPQWVSGDPARLRQILVNLLSNAVKFTDHGDVVVAVRTESQPGQGVRLLVEVTDTGIGIPADRMDRLFRSFSQVDASTTRVYGGTGLGLAISQRLAAAMGGELDVRSEVGVGSVFRLSALLRTSTAGRAVLPPLPALDGKSVLLVDDNATNRRILRRQIEAWGMVASDTAFPAEALEWVGAGAHYDLAVLDMQMPGLSGVELANALRQCPAGRDLPMVLLSSLGCRPQLSTGPDFAATLTKPVKSAALRDSVAGALHLRPFQSRIPEQRIGDDVVAGAPLRILFAEDNSTNQLVGRLMLAKLGHRVDVVGNGREAVEALRWASYDLVLMDVQMPEMDGLEATRRIRTDLPGPRQPHIVALTASVASEDRMACRDAGMDGYLAGPAGGAQRRAAGRPTASSRLTGQLPAGPGRLGSAGLLLQVRRRGTEDQHRQPAGAQVLHRHVLGEDVARVGRPQHGPQPARIRLTDVGASGRVDRDRPQ